MLSVAEVSGRQAGCRANLQANGTNVQHLASDMVTILDAAAEHAGAAAILTDDEIKSEYGIQLLY